MQETVKLQASLANTPRIGVAHNYAYPSAQLNLAAARRASECS